MHIMQILLPDFSPQYYVLGIFWQKIHVLAIVLKYKVL